MGPMPLITVCQENIILRKVPLGVPELSSVRHSPCFIDYSFTELSATDTVIKASTLRTVCEVVLVLNTCLNYRMAESQIIM